GLEVEASDPAAPPFSGVVVAEVLEVTAHPNADRLQITRVNVGAEAPLQVVCGAPNVAPGQRVPCALPGARLPGAVSIAQTTVRGIPSQGMLCSAKELGLSEDSSGLYLLSNDAQVGTDLRVCLALD